MIEMSMDTLRFRFPEVHEDAEFSVDFQRTLRVPDDDEDYPLPAGLGEFPLEHVDDHSGRVPESWLRHGGVMVPMHAAEALWINLNASYGRDGVAYPFAVKVAAGKINAVTGEPWSVGLRPGAPPTGPAHPRGSARGSGAPAQRRTEALQDYMVVPEQPWLDGFNTGDGVIRQFVAMPLGGGYTAEEQITGQAEFGGIQLLAYPMKAQAYQRILERERRRRAAWAASSRKNAARDAELEAALLAELDAFEASGAVFSSPDNARRAHFAFSALETDRDDVVDLLDVDMGLGAGGRIMQEICADPHDPDVWDLEHPARCFVHLARAEQWEALTGQPAPTDPPTPEQYHSNGIPWFDYTERGPVVPASAVLSGLNSVAAVAEASALELTHNDSVPVERVVRLQPRPRTRPVAEPDTW
jgi:hypothetical protein